MRKFFTAVAGMVIIACFLLYAIFDYSLWVILYHILVIGILCFGLFIICRFLRYVPHKRAVTVLRQICSFLFFLFLSIFYLLLLGSLGFWGREIELGMLVGYISTLNGLIHTLPIESWMLFTFLGLFFLIICAIYYVIRPKATAQVRTNFKPDLIKLACIMAGILILYQPLIKFKRNIHAAGEPVLAFIFPRSWHTETEKNAYKSILLNNTFTDRSCVDKVKNEPHHLNDRNVMIIIVDAMRRDHLSAYGYSRQTTPFLDSMLQTRSLTRITYPFSLSTNTLGGVANLFSSKAMGQFSFSGLRLMKYMQMKKYTTYAFLTGSHSRWYWLADVYRNDCDVFFESKGSLLGDDDDFVTIDKFESAKLDPQFFVYMHLMSTHILGKKSDGFKKYLPDKIGINTDAKEALINNYDNGVFQADYLIRMVFNKLAKAGKLDNTTIFITADHGELLGEDGRWEHNKSVHPDLQSIPMLIYDSDRAWYENTYSATLLDIAPTIADRIGYPIPECWKGVSLHQKLKNFQLNLQGVLPCDFPYGILYNNDSAISIDLLNKNHQFKRRFMISNNTIDWIETTTNLKKN